MSKFFDILLDREVPETQVHPVDALEEARLEEEAGAFMGRLDFWLTWISLCILGGTAAYLLLHGALAVVRLRS